ncbi:putative lipoprotein [Streptomyces ambofaciens ATCC 23877]|uniref:Putative lipoprotein n=1 Tax=Streptomyces ambofaciens (strain ATCC 23877 / 3486 / DSM 40053 / JCM 4204 / NBRC 12836 / NRRL B-2516) TaxID=278992 RepID=A0A0K2AY26_STRA7|nr:hypothetical protein [Streptomyces ambofaciens]AKZ57868.1 putative lipoprotein [Streptomyces ambofaciens ATCC 23877]
MNRRRPTLLAALTLTTAAALTLSACGSDDGPSGDNDKIAGADTGSSAPAASPTASAASQPDRPKIELPSDLSHTFEWPKTGDQQKDAVMADTEESIKAVDLAIVKQDALDKAYLYYYEGEAAAGTQSFIQNYVDQKASITGKYRFYAPEVAIDKDGTASFTYCEDQGKAFVKYLKTGKVRKTEVTAKSYVIYHASLKKNGDGVWEVRNIASQSGSAKCQP